MESNIIVTKTQLNATELSSHQLKSTTWKPEMLSGVKKALAEMKIRTTLLSIIMKHFHNPITVIKVLLKLDSLRRQVLGDHRLKKIAKIEGRHYWDLYTPGCPSPAFTRYIEGEINRLVPQNIGGNRFSNVFMAITKKCGLQCEHCYEWESLNKKETLDLDHLKEIVGELQRKGIGQIQFSGGEPLLRLDELCNIMESAHPTTEFWINTSGHKLTDANARKLRASGLKGATISLDHFNAYEHNRFRGNEKSYQWALSAIENAQRNNIVTGLSLCVTQNFTTKGNLMQYLELARTLGVSFIQVLEPRAVGHYKGRHVDLEPGQIKLLHEFYTEVNSSKKYRNYPIITYHGYHQRNVGCFGSGNRSFYIDTDGDMHACPFCQKKSGSASPTCFDASLQNLRNIGCHAFEVSDI